MDHRLLADLLGRVKNSVLHVIIGIDDIGEILSFLQTIPIPKVLLLGFKNLRKGKLYLQKSFDTVQHSTREWYRLLPVFSHEIVSSQRGVVAFDNLALEQLNVRRILTERQWSRMYQGNDGSHTFYLDAVEEEFAKSSTATERHSFSDYTVKEMFQKIQ